MAHEHFQMMQMSLEEVKDRLMESDPDLVETQCLMIAIINAIEKIKADSKPR